jgi:formyl-CoA transferase/CoA:oxalate CoA-transferase
MTHPKAGQVKQTGVPLKLSETPGRLASPPPLLGEHTDRILSELGYSDAQRSAMRADGAI